MAIPVTPDRLTEDMKKLAKAFGKEWPADLDEQEALLSEHPSMRDQYERYKLVDTTTISATESSYKAKTSRGEAASQTRDSRAEREELTGPPIIEPPPPDEYTKGKTQLAGPYGAKREASGYPIVETPQFYPDGPSYFEMIAPQSSNASIDIAGPVQDQFMVRKDSTPGESKNFPLQTSVEDLIEKAREEADNAIHDEQMKFGWGYAKQKTDEERKAYRERRWRNLETAFRDPKYIRRSSEKGKTQAELDVDIFGKSTTLGATPDIDIETSKTLEYFRSALARQKKADLEAHGTSPETASAEAIAWANSLLGAPQWWQNPKQKAAKLREKPETYSVLGFGVDVYPSGTVVETTPAQMARIIGTGSSLISGMAGSLASEVTPGLAEARKESEIAPIKDVTGADNAWDRAVDSGLLNIKAGRGVAEEAYDAATNADAPDWLKKAAYGTGLVVDIVAVPLVPGSGIAKGGARAAKELAFMERVLGAGTDVSLPLTTRTAHGISQDVYVLGRILEENPVTNAIAKRLDLVPGDVRLVAAERAFADTNDLTAAIDLAEKAKAVEKSGRSPEVFLKDLTESNPYGKRMLKELGGHVTAEEAISWLAKKAEGNEISKKAAVIMSKLDEVPTNPRAIHEATTQKILRADDMPRYVQDTLRMNPDVAAQVRAFIGEGSLGASPQAILSEILSKPIWRKELLRTITLDKTLGHIIEETAKLPAWRALDENPFYLLTGRTAVTSEENAAKILKAARETDVSKAIQEGIAGRTEGVLKEAQEADAELAGAFHQSRIPLTPEGVQAIYDYIQTRKADTSFQSPLLDEIITDMGAGAKFDNKGFSQTISSENARKLIEMQIDDVARLSPDGKILAITEKEIRKLPQSVQTDLLKPVPLRRGAVVKEIIRLRRDETLGDVSSLGIPAQKALAAMQAEMAGIDKTLSTQIKELTTNEDLWKLYGFTSAPSERAAMLALIFIPRPKIIWATTSDGVKVRVGNLLEDAIARSSELTDLAEGLSVGGRSTPSKLSDLVSPIAVSRWNEAMLFIRSELDTAKRALRRDLVAEASRHGTAEMTDALERQSAAVRTYLGKVAEIAAPHKGKGIHSLPAANVEELLTGIYFTLQKEEIINKHLRSLASETKALRPSDAMYNILETALRDYLRGPGARPPIGLSKGHPEALLQKEISEMMNDMIAMRFKDIIEGRAFDYMAFLRRSKSLNERMAGALFQMGDAKVARLFTAIDEIAADIADANKLAKQVDQYGADRMRKIQTAIATGKPVGLSPEDVTIIKKIIEGSFDAKKIKESLEKIAADPILLKLWNNGVDVLLSVQYALMLSFRTRFHGANLLTAPFIMMSTLGGAEAAKALTSWLDGARLSAFMSDVGRVGEAVSGLGKGGKIDNIAFTDQAGRAYTWRDLSDIAREGSILMTQKGSPSANKILGDNAQFLVDSLKRAMNNKPWGPFKWLWSKTNVPIEWAQSFAEFSDSSFRLGTLISSLKRGEDVSQAIQKSREALFDYGKMTDWERQYIAGWFQFYSFTRASTVSTLMNLIENPTRVANQLKLAKGAPLWGDEEELKGARLGRVVGHAINQSDNPLQWDSSRGRSLFYEQDYMQLRPLLSNSTGYVKLVDGKRQKRDDRVLTYGPPIPAVDSFILLAKILSIPYNQSFQEFDIGEISTERSNPVARMIVAPQRREELKEGIVERGYVDPRYLTLIRAAGLWPMFKDLFELQSVAEADPKAYTRGRTQSKSSFREENPETGLVTENVQWRLTPNSAEANAFYWLVITSELIGAGSILKDYAPLAVPFADVSEVGPDLTTSPSELFGATTDSRRDTPASLAEDVKYKEQYTLKPK